jgi:NAD(P)H-dependent FMN reductase
MITVISGSNRKGSECLRFARLVATRLEQHAGEEVKLLALEEIPHNWFFSEMYDKGKQDPALTQLQDDFILAADKFVFVIPEYNGTYPGAVKLFIDAVSVRQYKDNFTGKKVGMVGIASGRAGNIRGMDHLTTVMHHLGASVWPFQLPISRIKELMDEHGQVTDAATLEAIEKFAREFVGF